MARFCNTKCYETGKEDFHNNECQLLASQKEYPAEDKMQHARALQLCKKDPDFNRCVQELQAYDGEDSMLEKVIHLHQWIVDVMKYAPGIIPENFNYVHVRRVYRAVN